MGTQDKGKERGSQKKAPKHTLMEKRKIKEEKKKREQYFVHTKNIYFEDEKSLNDGIINFNDQIPRGSF